MQDQRKTLKFLAVAACAVGVAGRLCAATCLVEDGAARAEIVIAETPTRSASLAAEELRNYIEKISGATLNVVAAPTGEVPVKIYVGQSAYTDKLGLKADDLKYGAFRMVSGPDWLALIGYDEDFVPRGPWARSHADWGNNVATNWDAMTGSFWGDPIGQTIYRDYNGRAFAYQPGAPRVVEDGKTGLWSFDELGSLNAVYQFLRELGVRWYMPGELGEIVPQRATIELTPVDKTVHPRFPFRVVNFALYGRDSQDSILWSMRLGVNNPYGMLVSHGLKWVTGRDEMKEQHPDYYALYGVDRNTTKKKANQCLSSPGLFEETVRYARMMYDVHNVPMVSIMPSDGYTSLCQCPLCEGKGSPERGPGGGLSDYVWDFVNRVAKELYKTHPDRLVSCCAYNSYRLPPEKIDKLSPNVVVCIVLGRPRNSGELPVREELTELREAWSKKTAHKLILWHNYPQGSYPPSYWPHVAAQGLRDAEERIQGEFDWLPADRGLAAPGVNHLSAYVLTRLFWDPDQDVEAMLDEYYRLFYGPAAAEMRAFIEYCESNYSELTKSPEMIDATLALFASAQRRVKPESIYGQRLARIEPPLDRLRNRAQQLRKDRGPVRAKRLDNFDNDRWWNERQTLQIDGKLDEPFWTAYPRYAGLRDARTGKAPLLPTQFMARWWNNALYLAIRCDESEGKTPVSSTTRNEDPALWQGDYVSILLETDARSFYEIAVNPAGAVLDLDRADGAETLQWDSQAEVAAHVGDGYWSVEARIPVTPDSDDPLHRVLGHRPSKGFPWHFNIYRQDVGGDAPAQMSFAPTGTNTVYDDMTFGQLDMRK